MACSSHGRTLAISVLFMLLVAFSVESTLSVILVFVASSFPLEAGWLGPSKSLLSGAAIYRTCVLAVSLV